MTSSPDTHDRFITLGRNQFGNTYQRQYLPLAVQIILICSKVMLLFTVETMQGAITEQQYSLYSHTTHYLSAKPHQYLQHHRIIQQHQFWLKRIILVSCVQVLKDVVFEMHLLQVHHISWGKLDQNGREQVL